MYEYSWSQMFTRPCTLFLSACTCTSHPTCTFTPSTCTSTYTYIYNIIYIIIYMNMHPSNYIQSNISYHSVKQLTFRLMFTSISGVVRRRSKQVVWPFSAALCNGVLPYWKLYNTSTVVVQSTWWAWCTQVYYNSCGRVRVVHQTFSAQFCYLSRVYYVLLMCSEDVRCHRHVGKCPPLPSSQTRVPGCSK